MLFRRTRKVAPIMVVFLFVVFLFNSTFAPGAAQSEPRGLLSAREMRCEYAVNPIGVGTASPRLDWIDESNQRGELQTAYQVLVSSSLERLRENLPDMWDSGKVASDQNIQIVYQGQPLASGQRC